MVDVESAAVLHRISTRDGNFVPLFSWAPDGQHYAFRSHSDKNVKIANSKTGEVIQEITAQSLGENELPVRGGRPQRRRVGQVDSIQWSPDGKELLLGVATEREKAERQLPSVDRVYQQAKNVWGIETWHWNGRQCEFVESRFLVQDFTASRFRYGMFSIAPDSKGVTFLVKDHLFYFDRATKQTTECVLPPKTHSNAAGCWFSSRCPLGTES
jgi:WD40 repeat protein